MDELILKCLQGAASSEEQQEVWNWLKDEANFEHYKKMRDTWIAVGVIKSDASFEIERRYQKIQDRINSKTKRMPRVLSLTNQNAIWKVAAIVVFALLIGSVGTYIITANNFNQTTSGINKYEVEVPMGAKINMSLADGTKVWLNAGSKLVYSQGYNKTNRQVALIGEGYFEVAKNKKLPFLVEAGGLQVKAVGTAFNVKAYPDEKEVEATLIEGIIDVTEGKQTIRLTPNEKATFIRNSAHIIYSLTNPDEIQTVPFSDIKTVDIILSKDVNTTIYTSWRSERWIFERESLADFVKKLERRYDVRVYVMDAELNKYKISGSIDQQTLGQLLNAVRLTVPINYKIINKEVVLTLDKRLENDYKSLMN